ncbi:MAG: MBL fold metallo-hydrolase [Ruminococcaceae bacterium]|nr:MBL fold metallo-hydrolase [Oscillospiraceae bacterium]
MLRYCSLFSGSSGNCTYVGTASGGLLIDVGVSARRISNALKEREIDPQSIRAVLLTHEHSDHVAGLRVLCKQYGWPVIASEGTLDALAEQNNINPEQRLFLLPKGQRLAVAGLQITPFDTPHDSRQCYGYRIDSDDGRSLAMTTDLGYMPQAVMDTILGCQFVHIESNHDPDMLMNGGYPYWLKQRIRGQGGHLSNQDCAAVLPDLLEAGATRMVLAHLSEHNNTPAIAQNCAESALRAYGATQGRDYLLSVAKTVGDSPVLYF